MVGFGRQMDAAAINWTLPWRLGQDFLETIRCRQRSTLGMGNAHEEGQNRGVVGRPSWRSSFPGDPGAKFLCGELGIGTKTKRGAKRKKGWWALWAAICWEFHQANALLTSSNASEGQLSECAS